MKGNLLRDILAGGAVGAAFGRPGLIETVKSHVHGMLASMVLGWLQKTPGGRVVAENVAGVVEVKFYVAGQEVSPNFDGAKEGA